MTFKDNAAKEKFKKIYRLYAPKYFIVFALIFSITEDMEQSQEKSFDKLAELFFKSNATTGVILAQIDQILDILRKYWAYGNIIPAK